MNTISPFKYGSVVSGNAFTGRSYECSKLTHNLISGIHTTIISPRRWGKSSLVEKTVKDITKNNKNTKAIFIDLFSISSEQEFLEIFTREVIRATSSKLQDRVHTLKSFFKHISPRFTLGGDLNSDFSIGFDWNEAQKHKDEILNLPEAIASQKKIRIIICLDEFQNIASYQHSDELEKAMRACWQHHQHVSYCLYGSKRHMMETLFNESSRPFYRFSDIMLLNKIPKDDWISFITKQFKNSGKSISKDLAERIPLLMNDHPWYVQQFAAYIWRLTENSVSEDELYHALIELIETNSPLYQNEIETLSSKQVNLLKAIHDGEKQFSSTRVMQNYDLGTPINITRNRKSLEKNDIIYRIDEKSYDFLDPVFKLWFMITYYHADPQKMISAEFSVNA